MDILGSYLCHIKHGANTITYTILESLLEQIMGEVAD
jgi:hypothetical protein